MTPEPLSPSLLTEIDRAAQCLRDGGTVVFPTETVYGLGASALSARASAKIFEIKRRPEFNPLIVHVPSLCRARKLVKTFPKAAVALAEALWPGPLTIVLPKSEIVPDIVTAGLPTIAIRVPRHPIAHELLVRADIPVAAPSANFFGTVSPTDAAHARESLEGKVDLILDGGPCEVGLESTIVGFLGDGPPVLLRPGGTPREAIEAIVGPLAAHAAPAERPLAPGMLSLHYAPRTPIAWGTRPPLGQRAGALCFRGAGPGFAVVEALSPAGDLREAGARLFAALRRLDRQHLDVIVAERFPDEGLGVAINDRLDRATQGRTV